MCSSDLSERWSVSDLQAGMRNSIHRRTVAGRLMFACIFLSVSGRMIEVRCMSLNGKGNWDSVSPRISNSAHGLLKDRKSTRLNSSHKPTSYAVFCLKKKINPSSNFTLNFFLTVYFYFSFTFLYPFISSTPRPFC